MGLSPDCVIVGKDEGRSRMGDKPSSSVAPRKMKFTPKIPLRKKPKTPAPKLEEPDTHVGDLLDSRLLRLVKQAEHTSRRSPISERKASMEITFGRIEKRIAQSFGIQETEETIQDPENFELASSGLDKKDEYADPWDYYSYYPVTLPLRRPFVGNPEILDKKEFGEASEILEEYDERRVNAAKELALEDENTDRPMFFIQMPAAMPVKAKDKDGIMNMNDMPVGYMGRMMIYKSGAVKMKLGDAIFDVSPGSDCMFAQDVMAINIKQKQCCVLGGLTKRAIINPDVDYLLNS